ncbi:MAG: hydrogenase maturation protease [Desulfurococcaceae archaeon]|nr:hydrogenase maturation protease [Desulfurococcaceae archaeon]
MIVLQDSRELSRFLESIIVPGETVVVGLGNELRCDDGFGVYVALALSNVVSRYSKRRCVEVVNAGTAPEAYLDTLSSRRVVVLVDAVLAQPEPPTIVVLRKEEVPPQGISLSTHSLDLRLLLDLVEGEVYLVGTRPRCLELNLGVTESVARAIKEVVGAFLEALKSLRCIKLFKDP